MPEPPADALIMAGGRIDGAYARAAGTAVKGLVPVGGKPLVRWVAEALLATPGIARVGVVGPEAVRAAAGETCLWAAERGSAIDNLEAGLERLGPGGAGRVLLCGTDAPALAPEALEDFLQRAPVDADICLPAVRKEAFQAAFPRNSRIYVRLREGAFTGGSQYLARAAALLENLPLLRDLFSRRKSQLGMARTFGVGLAWRLLTGRLGIAEIEARASDLTGFRCRAVLDCRAGLAFDLDNLPDLRYLERWWAARPGQ
jgi:molybdopterin-guanine dinucleotide biosynthesis protein A